MYGDLSYPLRVELERPFVNPAAGSTPEQINYKKSMDEVQTLIEYGFRDILSFSDFVDFKKKLRMGLSSVGHNQEERKIVWLGCSNFYKSNCSIQYIISMLLNYFRLMFCFYSS